MRRPLIVFAGGGAGACLRGLLLAWLNPLAAVAPLPVLVVNALGAFALGVVYVLADEAGLLRAETRLFLAVGVLGGFTTFSTLGWGGDQLFARGALGVALGVAYLAASVAGGVVAVEMGLLTGRKLAAALAQAASGGRRGRGRVLRRPQDARADMGAIEAEARDERA